MPLFERIPEPLKTLLATMPCVSFPATPCVSGGPLHKRKVCLVSTAGLHLRTDRPFLGLSAECRELPATARPSDIVMSHSSPNFDRSGFHVDWNVAFPLDRLRELAQAGEVGDVAETHYSFMGATEPERMEPHARAAARKMRAEGVDAVLLVPM
ncbi:MAG TPA: glycine/sarcosine/betaine reductase selenoprotein B family protein [Polyangia bacterium]|nr:glycine/sarcosine/betaine reductase selenoprotein B family protein [Polyangia bacterium]